MISILCLGAAILALLFASWQNGKRIDYTWEYVDFLFDWAQRDLEQTRTLLSRANPEIAEIFAYEDNECFDFDRMEE